MTDPGYGEDLAFIHHTHFGDVARHAAAMVVRELTRARAQPGALVVDLGCGSGILAAALTDAGYDVFGVDTSADLLALAVDVAPAATFKEDSLLDVDFPKCAAVTAVGEVLNYAFDERVNRRTLPRLFRRIHTALAPKGFFLFDVAGPGRAGRGGLSEACHDQGEWTLWSRAVEDERGGTLTRDITVFRRVSGRLHRRSDERHVLGLYRPNDVARELEDAGFEVHRLSGYGPLPFGKGWAGFVATKA